MFLMKVFFAVLIIICAVFYVMYLWDFALVLLVVVCALPVLMFVTTFITKLLMTAEMTVRDGSASKREDFPVFIRLNNRSIFPIGKADAHIEYYNVFNNEINMFDLHMPVQPLNEQSVTFQLSSQFCGIINIKCVRIYIYDPLRIFKFRIAKNLTAQVAVMPEGHEIGGEVSYLDRTNEESSVFSEHKPGDDPSEIFDLRGYHPGDKLNRIHWKLSSKKDEFIVKDYSLPVDTPCTLFLNLKCYEKNDPRYTLPVFDTLVETLVSVSQFMLENERLHSIVFYSGKSNGFVERHICDPDDLAGTVQELILSVTDNLYCEPPELYFTEHSGLSLSSFTFITSVPDTPILEYIDDNVDADILNALVVVATPAEASGITDSYPNLRTIPVFIGRISSSVKDIEL
ncbi:Protein of unknown function DUF58 [Ruminococcus sp. YRD2003]|uniref:DUF58 domain-containing protein n=1 Tax=Ruminococcus sp. YRD2003 TaxID=1452313 RepID=UPI0008B7C850|nr:Protein of unknown function DUF58 [Ruminococcus flavefaciens]